MLYHVTVLWIFGLVRLMNWIIYRGKRKRFNVVMTTSLSSDVLVGYFSWAEYDIMAPVQPKTEQLGLLLLFPTVVQRTSVDKVQTLKQYNEKDYVTEKFFQSLVPGNRYYILCLFPNLGLYHSVTLTITSHP